MFLSIRIFLGKYAILRSEILNYPRSCIIDSPSMYPVHFNRIFLKVSKISKNSVALVKNVQICLDIY